MVNRTTAACLATFLCGLSWSPSPAWAENPMGYHLLSGQQAAGLPRRGGVLGLKVGSAQQITDAGMTFDVLRVDGVRPGSPAARAGFNPGDQVIAVDGTVFPSVRAFAAYVGSAQPGQQLAIDYMPAGGGPQQAQRVAVTLGAGGPAATAQAGDPARPAGMSTGTKVAIGVGAAALFGCYELGCFSRAKPAAGSGTGMPMPGRQAQ